MNDLTVEVAGEQLVLMPEGGAYWPRFGMLLVADVHFGKAATLRALGIPVPRGTTMGTLSRLDATIARTGATRVVFLGDFLHAVEGRASETLRVLNEWRRGHSSVAMTLVRGNHDARAGDPPPEMKIECVTEPFFCSPFVLHHHPRAHPDGYVLCGHIHPAVRIAGRGKQRMRLGCFWFGPAIGVLPAFGDFTGAAEANVQLGDRVFVLADNTVMPLPIAESNGSGI